MTHQTTSQGQHLILYVWPTDRHELSQFLCNANPYTRELNFIPLSPSRALLKVLNLNMSLSTDHWHQNINMPFPILKKKGKTLNSTSLLPFVENLLENITNLPSRISLLLFSAKIYSIQACALTTSPKSSWSKPPVPSTLLNPTANSPFSWSLDYQ